jgi:beta-glucosidase
MIKFNVAKMSERTLSIVLTTGMTCLLSASVMAQQNLAETPADEIIFSASHSSPWRLYLGSSNNWMVPVIGPVTTSHKSKVVTVSKIDSSGKADAIQASWKSGLGQVYWQEDNPRDYRALAKQDGALSLVLRVDKKPKKSVDLKMDCGYPCAGSLNMTNLLKSVPEKQWFRISLKLNCFEDAGANLGHIVSPLVIATTGSFKVSISDVRILTAAPEESLVACN